MLRFLFVGLMLSPTLAYAVPLEGPSQVMDTPVEVLTPITTVTDAKDTVDKLVAAAQGGQWNLFVGVVLTLLVWLLDKVINLKARVGSKALPWIAVALSISGTIGLSLSSGMPLGQGLVQGFLTGAASVGLWELIFKHGTHSAVAKDISS